MELLRLCRLNLSCLAIYFSRSIRSFAALLLISSGASKVFFSIRPFFNSMLQSVF